MHARLIELAEQRLGTDEYAAKLAGKSADEIRAANKQQLDAIFRTIEAEFYAD
jgi:hypothetical protein